MLGVALATAWAQPADLDEHLDAVVLVQQGSATCAGVRIGPDGVVATAYHCVVAGGRPRVVGRDGSSWIGRVRAFDVAHDLALIDVPEAAGASWRNWCRWFYCSSPGCLW